MAAPKQLTTYIALFHNRDNAASAIRELGAAGFNRSGLTVIGGGNGMTYSESAGIFGEGYGYGHQSALDQIGVPGDDRKHLQDGIAHGGTVLALEGAGERAEEIEKIFSKHSTKKIDETDMDRTPYAAPVGVAALPTTTVDSTVIAVAEEELVVGKREVDLGGVRVYRRIVNQPISESINLREEHVVIDRRPVDRPLTDADLLGGDRVIELTETDQEAVVSKTARVVEEVRVGKEVTEHTETIRDTVRHTEVDVEELGPTDATNRSS